MRLTEQFRNRLQKLAGMDSKKRDPKIKKPFPILKQPPTGSNSTESMSYSCTPCEGCQPSSSGPFSSIEECEGTCSETNIDTFFSSCPGPQCGGFNNKEEFCNRCELAYDNTQQWAQQNGLPNCDCCDPRIEGGGCTNPTANNYNPEATVDDGSCLIELFMCTNCELVSVAMVPLYEDAFNWSTFAPSAFGGDGAYSLGYLFYGQTMENDYFSLDGTENYVGNMETCGYMGSMPVASYDTAFGECLTLPDIVTDPSETEGCTDPAADNYDSNATIENNTCEYTNFDACAELEANPTQYYVVEFGDYAALNPNQVSDTFSNVICNNACHTDSWNMGGGFQYGTCLSWATIYINPEVACQEVYDNYNFNQIASINSYNNCPDNADNPETCCVNITGPLG